MPDYTLIADWTFLLASALFAGPPTAIGLFVYWRVSNTSRHVAEVHDLVNGQREALVREIADLKTHVLALEARHRREETREGGGGTT